MKANLVRSSSTDLPVSKTEDRRLFVNTSGETSVNIWFVARRRRTRADVVIHRYFMQHLLYVPNFPL
jgi:hypothetical protein